MAEEQARSDDLAYQDKVNEVRANVVIQRYWNLALAYSGYDITEQQQAVLGAGGTGGGNPLQRWPGPAAGRPPGPGGTGELPRPVCFQWRQRQESFVADLNALRSQAAPDRQSPDPTPLKPRPLTLKLDDLLTQAEIPASAPSL